MDVPKISVLIPLKNNKNHIEQCLNSILAQSFQDYEIIVRDDCSTDGSVELIQEHYLSMIESGKLKLFLNEKTIGEFPTINKLLRDSTGKYVMILKGSDAYLPNALKQMYETAEEFNADVVHGIGDFTTDSDGIISGKTSLKTRYIDRNRVNKVEIISKELLDRFNEWHSGGISVSPPLNLFQRKFLADNELKFETFGTGLTGENRFFTLQWVMKAKVIVKTPELFYISRRTFNSFANAEFTPDRVAALISEQIKFSRYLDDFFAREDFFKDDEVLQYRARMNMFYIFDQWWIKRNAVYKDGITLELHHAVKEAFKQYYGEDSAFPIFLFHCIHATEFKHPVDALTPSKESNED